MSLQASNILSQIFKSSAAWVLGGATIGAAIVMFIMKIARNKDTTYIILCVGAILLAGLLIFLIYLFWQYIQLQKEKRMDEAISKDAAKARKQHIKEEVKRHKEKLSNALIELKKRKINIYQLPWVLLIGEPRSGKTKTLENSKLHFPLGEIAHS